MPTGSAFAGMMMEADPFTKGVAEEVYPEPERVTVPVGAGLPGLGWSEMVTVFDEPT